MVRDDAVENRPARVLDVQVVDPRTPVVHRGNGVTTGHHQVARIEAEPHVRQLEHLLDLPGSLHVAAGLIVERRFVTSVHAVLKDAGKAIGEQPPFGVRPPKAAVLVATTRISAANIGTRVSEGRLRSGLDVAHRVKCRQQLVQVSVDRLDERAVIGVRQLEVPAGESEASAGQPLVQFIPATQIAGRTEIDARIPSPGHLVEQRDRVWDVRVDPHRQLERAKATRSVRDRNRLTRGRTRHGSATSPLLLATGPLTPLDARPGTF